MSQEYTGQIERLADRMRHAIEVDGTHYRHIDGMVVASWATELDTYAATLKAAQGGVTEAMVERAAIAFMQVRGLGMPRPWESMLESSRESYRPAFRAALEAALSAEPAARGEEWSRRMAAAEAGQYVGAGAHGIEDRPAPLAQPADEVRELVGALRIALATIDDYIAYEHDGDPWKEDARAMGEMDINDFASDGRLERCKAALAKFAHQEKP